MNGKRRCSVCICTHTHTHTYSHKKEQNNAIRSSMDGPRDDHTKWSQSERERQIPHDITYTWDLWHKWTYLQNRNRPKKKNHMWFYAWPQGLGQHRLVPQPDYFISSKFLMLEAGELLSSGQPCASKSDSALGCRSWKWEASSVQKQSFHFWSPRSTPSDGSRRLPELSISEVIQRNLFPNQEGWFPQRKGRTTEVPWIFFFLGPKFLIFSN